jgi:ABC-type lipoprotein export system ATPase subunit
MVLVTHETTVARRAQRIAVMSKGRLAIRSSAGTAGPGVTAAAADGPFEAGAAPTTGEETP